MPESNLLSIINVDRFKDYLLYFKKNFNQSFIPGLGTEDIFSLLRSVQLDEVDWIDLGGGTSSYFWSLGLNHVKSLVINDKYLEPLMISEVLRGSESLPDCYKYVIRSMAGSSRLNFKTDLDKITYSCFDALHIWPEWLDSVKFNVLTQFGLMGLSESAGQCEFLFQNMIKHSSPGAYLIGANWKKRKCNEHNEGATLNRIDLDVSLYNRIASKFNLKVLTLKEVLINDDEFSHVYIYCFQVVHK